MSATTPETGAIVTLPRLTPRPVTAPWCAGPGTLYSWECVYRRGSAWGITDSEHRAMKAVTDVLRLFKGEGLVQRCRPGPDAGTEERDQYAYGDVIGRARTVDDMVVWTAP